MFLFSLSSVFPISVLVPLLEHSLVFSVLIPRSVIPVGGDKVPLSSSHENAAASKLTKLEVLDNCIINRMTRSDNENVSSVNQGEDIQGHIARIELV